MEAKIRLRFSKADTLRFIGHLDFLKVFQQAIRRSVLPIAYSQGFNPHQIISFALPLPLGMVSINDYADITLTAPVSPAEIVDKLNAAAPRGLSILAAYEPKGKTAAAATIAADYLLAGEISQEAIDKVLKTDTLITPKKTKSGIKDTNVRPDIIHIQSYENGCLLRLVAGSAGFLNPLLVARLLTNDEDIANSSLSRLELYQTDGNAGRIPL